MNIRQIEQTDLIGLLQLYKQLHDNAMPIIDDKLSVLWKDIMADKNHHIIVIEEEGKIVCSCVLIIVPNLTHHQRPYALIENVVTDQNFRKKGYATAVLDYAKQIAIEENCYKIMLLTGSKLDSTLKFYEQAGYNRNDKTAFIQWL